MSGEAISSETAMPETGRGEHIDSLVRRWKAGEAHTMTGEEVDELDNAIELGLVTQEELMERPDAA
ncbi:MAG TPA: hypothetical protein VFP35_03510 [Candidatus Saccharimonadales bacterium]|nr:hypothetical protein [Candidatus Saccharimonadales bacterium]